MKFVRIIKANKWSDEDNIMKMESAATFKTEDGRNEYKYFTVFVADDDDSYYEISDYDITLTSEEEVLDFLKKKCENIAEKNGWKFISISRLYY